MNRPQSLPHCNAATSSSYFPILLSLSLSVSSYVAADVINQKRLETARYPYLDGDFTSPTFEFERKKERKREREKDGKIGRGSGGVAVGERLGPIHNLLCETRRIYLNRIELN